MDHYQDNRSYLDILVAQAEKALATNAFGEAVGYLSEAATFALENHTGVFLDRHIETVIERIAQHVNVCFAPVAGCAAEVGFLMTSIHPYGGHSKIAWRWMQLDRSHRFQLVLTAQKQYEAPEQITELIETGRLTCVAMPDGDDTLRRIRDARDQLAGADMLVMNIHPNDVVGAVIAACLRDMLRTIFIDHAFFSFSVGMPSAHALCCTSPAAVAIATQERLVSPEHLVWYRNSPEWVGQDIEVDVCALREKLGVPVGSHLLLSSGSEHKYYPVRGVGLLDLVAPMLDRTPDAHLVIVGIWQPDRIWGPLLERLAPRLHLLHPVSERELLQYILACDIYLDSVPNHSGGAAQQAMLLGKPTLAYADLPTYRAHLAPQFFSVDDFSWIHFSRDSYLADLDALVGNLEFRLERGRFLQTQVASRISERDNFESIQASYRKARQAPLMADTLLDESLRVENPALHQVHDEIAKGLNAYKNPKSVAPHPMQDKHSGPAVRAIAFHLPQFHEIPENNTWWGKGFTEWVNVKQGKPLFEGHHQPFVPTELGYYDLSSVEVLERQAQLAREHGIHGFCFYHYWFDGKRLLEKPVDQLLEAKHIDLPFCLCWANENWTKRWDGGDSEVLMYQSYSKSLDDQFAGDLAPYFSDSRYIKIDGKPVLLVYRTDIIPDLANTVTAWRDAWRSHGVGEVYLVAVESFTSINPSQYGFDACAEFPPHQVNFWDVAPEPAPNLISDIHARVGDYEKLADAWINRPTPNYKRFRSLLPSWDNAARRRKGNAFLLVNANPTAYESWLSKTVAHTLREQKGEERLVFINAWNEWGEGCTLEPDARWGRAYLEATQRVMRRSTSELLQELDSRLAQKPSAYMEWLSSSSVGVSHPLYSQFAQQSSVTSIAVAISTQGFKALLDKTLDALHQQSQTANEVYTLSTDTPIRNQLGASQSTWTLLLCEGDTLEKDALLMLESAIVSKGCAESLVVYFDHDEIDSNGVCSEPHLKPEFNHDLLLSYPYMGRSLAVRTSWILNCLGSHSASPHLSLPQSYKLALDAARTTGPKAFVHIPTVIAHLAAEEPSVFAATSEMWQLLANTVANHVQERAPGTQVLEGPGPGTFHMIYPLESTPLVSIVVPTRDQLPFLSRCIEALIEKTNYPNFEILVVDNDSQTAEARDFLAGLQLLDPTRIRVLQAPGSFNFSRMNNLAVNEAKGEFILMLNNDTAAIQPDWLTHMVRNGLREDVGVVGARLLYPDGKLQHAGIVLGLRGPAEHPLLGLSATAPGYLYRAQVQQNFSAVTAACLLVKKILYQEVGGLDETAFAVSYNDVDFCLRIAQTGKRIVWTPLATLLHEGSVSQKSSIESTSQEKKVIRFTSEQAHLYQRWPAHIANDPAYNPNLSLAENGYEIETNPLLRFDKMKGLTEHRIVAFAADVQGCGQYRIFQPMQAMLDAGMCTGGASPEMLGPNLVLRSGADRLIFQRPNDDLSLSILESLIPLKGIKKIYEVDDHISRVPLKSPHRESISKDVQRRISKAIGLCDRLVVSTEALARELTGLNDDIRVVQNRLASTMWGTTPPTRPTPAKLSSRKPRVGWAGGIGHQVDIEMVADVIKSLADQVDWIFFGMCPEAIRPYVREFYAGVSTLDYPKRLTTLSTTWDLTIAPLEINAFNECKSNLKLLEYGWCGVPVVCTDITPYQGDLPCRRVKNRFADWRNAILSMTSDLDFCREEGLRLQQAVQSSWMLKDKNIQDWYEAWTA